MSQVIGYDFGSYVKCPECVGWIVAGSFDGFGRDREPLAVGQVEVLLDKRAKAVGVDRDDESSFDHYKDFPKRVMRGGECECHACGRVL